MNRFIEPLEARQLFAGGPEVTGFRIAPRNPVPSTGSLVFIVTFRDLDGVDPTSFDVRDLRVAGPNNFARYARAYFSESNVLGTERKVRYKIGPPGLLWNAADNGRYTVRLHGNGVSDNKGNFADSQHLGTFNVAISSPQKFNARGDSSLFPSRVPLATQSELMDELI